MAKRAWVALLRVKPDTVPDHLPRLRQPDGMAGAHDPAGAILQDHAAWHLRSAAAKTSPWQRCDCAAGPSRAPALTRPSAAVA